MLLLRKNYFCMVYLLDCSIKKGFGDVVLSRNNFNLRGSRPRLIRITPTGPRSFGRGSVISYFVSFQKKIGSLLNI